MNFDKQEIALIQRALIYLIIQYQQEIFSKDRDRDRMLEIRQDLSTMTRLQTKIDEFKGEQSLSKDQAVKNSRQIAKAVAESVRMAIEREFRDVHKK